MSKYFIKLCFMLILLWLTGCSTFSTTSKTPMEWITLANSGLSGQDNYSYSAHVETGINNNIKMSMINFSGQVHSHQEYSLHSTELDSTFLHPTKYMDIINKPNNKVTYANEPINSEAKKLIIKVYIEESEEQSSARWKSLLEQQFTQAKLSVKLDAIDVDEQQVALINSFVIKADQELDDMLKTLKVKSSYTLSIDTTHAMPTVLEEHAELNYLRNNEQHREYRHSNIQFQY